MFAAALIVFRESIEAGLVVGIVLAATRGVRHRGRWITLGVAGGIAGACLVALFAERLAGAFAGAGQELFDATILFFAVAMLAWHNAWMAAHGREMAGELKAVGAAVLAGERTLLALALVCGVAVLREGFEVVLFLTGVATGAGMSAPAIAAGGGAGIAGGAAVSALMYYGLVTLPMRHLFAATSTLITLLAAGLAVQAIGFLHQGGFITVLDKPVWDTSAFLPVTSLAGRLLQTVIGYTDQPDAAQLIAYVGTLLAMLALTRVGKA